MSTDRTVSTGAAVMVGAKTALILGACGSLLVAGLHLLLGGIMILIPTRAAVVSQFFGGPDVRQWGLGLVAVATLAIAVLFVAFALYTLAAAGQLKPLRFQRGVAWAIGVIYILRGLALVPEAVSTLLEPGRVPPQELVFSAVSLTIGLLHVVGLRRGAA